MTDIERIKEEIFWAIIKIIKMVKCVNRDRVAVYAAQASYFVLMSAVPFIMVLVLLCGAILPMDSATIMAITSEFLPEQFRSFGVKFLSEIFEQVNIPLISITTVFILWSASKGIRSIGAGIQNIYGENRGRGYIRDTVNSLLYTLAFIATIVLSIVVLIFGSPLQALLNSYFGGESALVLWLFDIKNIIFVFMLTFLFMMSYRGLAKSDIPINAQFLGAALAACGWIVFSFGFSIYIKYFSKYPLLYGGLATLLLLMLWLYMCMVILLLGAEVNKWRYYKKHPEISK
ncbi:MAG: YihY/virulence factor BrkB family protein [Oscillospiraceae bacterium]